MKWMLLLTMLLGIIVVVTFPRKKQVTLMAGPEQGTGNVGTVSEPWPLDEKLTDKLEGLVKELNPTNAGRFTNEWKIGTNDAKSSRGRVGYIFYAGTNWQGYRSIGTTNFLTVSNRPFLYYKLGGAALFHFTDTEWQLITNYLQGNEGIIVSTGRVEFWGPTNRIPK